MEQPETTEVAASPTQRANDAALGTQSVTLARSMVAGQSCPSCGTLNGARNAPSTVPSYIYALGTITPRFRTKSAEKEFAQVVGLDDAVKGLTDTQVLHKVLSDRRNRYLVRELCWVMNIGGLETYILVPRDPVDFDLLAESVRPRRQPNDLDLVIGEKGPIAPMEMCNGLLVPIVTFDLTYSFNRDLLFKAIPRDGKAGKKTSENEFEMAAEVLLDRIMQMADNAGATPEHRACTYLVVRSKSLYQAVAEAFARNESLTAVDVRPSPLSGTRNVLEVIISLTNRTTDVISKQFVRVDVTEEFPFLVSKLSPYYDI